MVSRTKPRVTITVNPEFLIEVDRFVHEHQDAGVDRSGVFDEALRLWRREQRRLAMIEQYSAPRSEEELAEAADWARIRAAAFTTFGRRNHDSDGI